MTHEQAMAKLVQIIADAQTDGITGAEVMPEDRDTALAVLEALGPAPLRWNSDRRATSPLGNHYRIVQVVGARDKWMLQPGGQRFATIENAQAAAEACQFAAWVKGTALGQEGET